MSNIINKLPAVFQTTTEKKFFDATFDQVFSKKDSDYIAGYLGRRVPGMYNPVTDFYIPEPDKNRTWWQLEPTLYSRNTDTLRTNIFFYEDLLEYIESYGGSISNQDRLFESSYYSYAPPIDYDMFVNYQNYYWIDQRLATINISGVLASDIIGKNSYTTPETARPAGLTLTTGLSISLVDDENYKESHTVEFIAGCEGIRLVKNDTDITYGSRYEFLPWDGSYRYSKTREITNFNWDATTWEVQSSQTTGDYITIQRGSADRNAWSRTNKWYHIDAINRTLEVTGFQFPQNAVRALRPIIQFVADLKLFGYGSRVRELINFGLAEDIYGLVIKYSDFQGKKAEDINRKYSINLKKDDLVVFFRDNIEFNIWDEYSWETPETWDAGTGFVNRFIFRTDINTDGTVRLWPYTSWETPIENDDMVIVLEDGPGTSAKKGQTWTYLNDEWSRVTNDKTKVNQPPLFDLYDRNKVSLSNPVTYPESNFSGNKIFSYQVNTDPEAVNDPVLGFPIVYGGIGQFTDIVFENNLIVNRYTYRKNIPIDGYYYYTIDKDPIIYNGWQKYNNCECAESGACAPVSKQRVIDKFVVGYGSGNAFKLSVRPFGYPDNPDLIVSINDTEIKPKTTSSLGYTLVLKNNDLYVDLGDYFSDVPVIDAGTVAPVVEVQTYTHDKLDPASRGYFEIPQQLEANPAQEEPTEFTASNLIDHFVSVIYNQSNFIGNAFGGPNNYRDTEKNRSLGKYILQNLAPAIKSMLVASEQDLDFITAARFSQDEYVKFKNRYLKTARQLINQQFDPVQYFENTVKLGQWVDEILKIINVSREFSSAFAYSYMIASNGAYFTESHTVDSDGYVILDGHADLSNVKNALYVYRTTAVEDLLILGVDYEIVESALSIEVKINLDRVPVGTRLVFAVYKDPVPAYIPSTPSKLGMYPVYIPRLELDTTFAEPAMVIIGHDGSKTIAYGDYRDNLLLELEKRIYNLIAKEFRQQREIPLRLESVRSGYFRKTRYSKEEYLAISESYLNKWSAKNKVNYRANDWLAVKDTVSEENLWKLYNYREAVNTSGEKLGLPGHWKGIFQYFYDTYCPDTKPWEMLGMSEMPSWWEQEYGEPTLNSAGQSVWTAQSQGLHRLWVDLELGIIRQGPSALFDPDTLEPLPQAMWARPGLSNFLPVDDSGELVSVMSIFDLAFSGNPYEPFDGYDIEWIYGDGAPAEQAWYSSSSWPYTVQELLYLTRPAMFGEMFWDTLGTEFSPGLRQIESISGPVRIKDQEQFVQNNRYAVTDPLFSWMRPKNQTQVVHAEQIDNNIEVRFGYQTWISDRILFLGKNIADTFGHKIRNASVSLANKLAGFTNKSTTNVFLESVSPGTGSDTLSIPSANFDVLLHKSPVKDIYAYSGVIIRSLSDGKFAVYGYDLLSQEFRILGRSDIKEIDISVGGTPAPFRYYTAGDTYRPGEIVRYNGVYYLSLSQQTVQKFTPNSWQKLRGLPTQGGISVSYKPIDNSVITKVPYGTIFKNPQEVFDFLIGWGDFLESQGWKFDDVNADTNLLNNWLNSAKQFLFWLNTSWEPDSSIQLSPLANKASLTVSSGYPNDIETISNGVYSILDKYGVAIPPDSTRTERDGRSVTVEPISPAVGGIYYLQITTSETEHLLIFDNVTDFNDVVYLPLYRIRQQRLRFNGFRTNDWYGKMEAPGYLISDNQLLPNFDTLVSNMRYYYDPNVMLDNQSIESLGRHLIGFESKRYLDNLQISDDIQYLFYKGFIREKGTQKSLDKLFRSTNVQTDDSIDVYEEWALRLSQYGNTVDQVSTEIRLIPEQNSGDVIVARLNYVPSEIGEVRQVGILNAVTRYQTVPALVFSAPDADPSNSRLVRPLRTAKGYIILDSMGRIDRVDVTDPGYGYLKAPSITIDAGTVISNPDILYAVWQGSVEHEDGRLDNIVEIDVDQTDIWVKRPTNTEYSLKLPTTENIDYPVPNAGYVNIDDVDHMVFDFAHMEEQWGTAALNPMPDQFMWVAKNFRQDWSVYKMINPGISVDVILDNAGYLVLRTPRLFDLGKEFSQQNDKTDFGSVIGLYSYTAIAKAQFVDTVDQKISSFEILKTGAGYTSVPDVKLNGESGLAKASILNGQVVNITLSEGGKDRTWSGEVTVTIDPPETIDYRENYVFSFDFLRADSEFNYYMLVGADNVPSSPEDVIDYTNISEMLIFKTVRFDSINEITGDYLSEGDKVWVDNYQGGWAVLKFFLSPEPPPPPIDV